MIENTWEEQVERLNARVVELMHEKEALQAQLEHQMDTIGTLTKQVLWQQEELDSLKTSYRKDES